MVATCSEHDKESFIEERKDEVANMCFMTSEDNEDKVNSNPNYNKLQSAFQVLYFDLEELELKNASKKKMLLLKMSSKL